MSSINLIKDRLIAGEILYGGWAGMGSTVATEILGHMGFDWVLVDGEHGNNDHASFVSQLLALNTGSAAAFVRPESNNPVMLKRLLDLGFYNFMIPMIENAEHARKAVEATRYPPQGIRGVSVSTRSNRFGLQADYFSKINSRICVVAQIETAQSVDQIESIASVDGIDCLFIGPQDLAASMGYLANPSEETVQELIKSAAQRICSLGKPAGILAGDEREALRYREWGYKFIGVSSDQGLIRRGVHQIFSVLKPRPS